MAHDANFSVTRETMRLYTRYVTQSGVYAAAFLGRGDENDRKLTRILWYRAQREAVATARARGVTV